MSKLRLKRPEKGRSERLHLRPSPKTSTHGERKKQLVACSAEHLQINIKTPSMRVSRNATHTEQFFPLIIRVVYTSLLEYFTLEQGAKRGSLHTGFDLS